MSEDKTTIHERRTWFHYFPEGTLEFSVITRVLVVIALLSLAALKGSQRTYALVGLCGFLWVDYILAIWWVIQTHTDLSLLAGKTADDEARITRSRRHALVLGAAPATLLMIAIAPWPVVVHLNQHASIITVLFGALFLLALAPAIRQLRSIGVEPAGWIPLVLIPVLQWFGVHRLLAKLHDRLDDLVSASGAPRDVPPTRGTIGALADVVYILAVLPWLILAGYALARGAWPASGVGQILPVCGTLLTAVFCVLDIAALEAVQRRFIAVVARK